MNNDATCKEQPYFKSFDLGLVSCLSTRGFSIVDIERQENSRVLFVVKREEGLDDVIQAFWESKCLVDAQAYFNQLKALKTRIYSQNHNR